MARPSIRRWLDQEQTLAWLLVGPLVLLLLGLVAYPFGVAVQYALSDRTLAEPGRFVGLANVWNLWDNQIYRQTLWNTIVYTIGATILKLGAGLGLALLLNETAPLQAPHPVGRAASLDRADGPERHGLAVAPDAELQRPQLDSRAQRTQPAGTAVADQPVPGHVLCDPRQHVARDPVLRDHAPGGAPDHPGELYEASAIDGAGTWHRFRHVTLPLLQPILLITLVLSVIWTFSDFQVVYGLTQGGPMNSTHVLATLSYQVGLASGNIGEGAAISLTMLPLLLVLIVWQIRHLRRGAGA